MRAVQDNKVAKDNYYKLTYYDASMYVKTLFKNYHYSV